MNHFIRPIFIAAILLSGSLRAAETDDQAAARKAAFDVAGAFTNEGFKLRDGHWKGALELGKPQLVQVNLFAGNQYWFVVGATPQAKKVTLTVYDETGAPVATDPYSGDSTAAAGFAPTVSGSYYLKIAELEGDPATFCVLYSYK